MAIRVEGQRNRSRSAIVRAAPEVEHAELGSGIEVPLVADIAAATIPPLAADSPASDAPTIEQQPEEPAAIPVAADSEKDVEDMATAAETVTNMGAGTERAQAMFGEMNERAKSAMEKSSRMFEELVDFTRGNVEAVVASGRAAAKGTETLVQEAADYGRKSFEKAQSAARTYASVKSPTDFFQLNSDLGRTSFDEMVAEASRLSEAYLRLVSDVVEPISSRFSAAAEKFKPTAL